MGALGDARLGRVTVTSYRLGDDGKMHADRLPSVLDERAYVEIEGRGTWTIRQQGKYRWCIKCQVAILTPSYDAHVETYHPKPV